MWRNDLRILLLFLTITFFENLPAQSQRPGAIQSKKAESFFNAAVSEDSLRRYVRELVALGTRVGGTRSNHLAANYLRSKFDSWGLHSEIVLDPPQMTYEEQSWKLEQVAPDTIPFTRPWPYGFSPPTGATTSEAIVLERRGEGISARGYVVLIDQLVNHRLYNELVAQGARAILSDAPGVNGEYVEWAMIGTLPPRDTNPIPVFGISRKDGSRLRQLIQAGKQPRVRFALASNVWRAQPLTVIATIAGESKERYVVFCAHGDSDSGGPGADDNASGEAVVLETARVLQNLITSGEISSPSHSIRFIVWGSEYASSQAYVERHAAELQEIAGVINFDEVGTGTKHQAIYFESNEIPWNRELLATLDAIGAEYCGKSGFWHQYSTNPSQGGTDSYSFLPSRFLGKLQSHVEIPATTIYTAAWEHPSVLKQTEGWDSRCWPEGLPLEIDYSEFYHSSGDLPKFTTERQPWRMVWATRAGGIALLRLLWR